MLLVAVLAAGIVADTGGARAVATGSGPVIRLAGTDPLTGDRVDLAHAEKPVVVNVWASWWAGCNEEAADLTRLARAHPEAQVVGDHNQDTREGGARLPPALGLASPEHLRPERRARVRARIAGPALDLRPRPRAPRHLPDRRCNRPGRLRGGTPTGDGMIELGAAGLAALLYQSSKPGVPATV
jgi:hypothetical protein